MKGKAANVTGRRANARPCVQAVILYLCGALGVAYGAAQPEPSSPTPVTPSNAVPSKPLDLRLGELRMFMAPREWFTALPADIDEVIVRGRRKPGEIPERNTVPPGLDGLFWGARNPSEAWRLLVPDPKVSIPPRDVDSPKEPPGAYRTRIGEPGKIF